MDESHKDKVDWKKPDTDEYVWFDSIYLKFKNRKKQIYSLKFGDIGYLDKRRK